jgi:hypothetical protein
VTRAEQIDGERVTMLALETLGVPESEDGLASDSAIASALRRAASFEAPIARQRLVGSVVSAVAAFVPSPEALRAQVNDVLDRVIGHGDLLEVTKSELGTGRLILLRPPAFVASTNVCFPLGVRPDGAPILTDLEISGELAHEGAIRAIRTRPDEVRQILVGAGLQEVSIEQWIGAPAEIAAGELIGRYKARLAEASKVGEIEGIEILDPESDRSFYRGRFRSPSASDTGVFVSRRPQQFGPSRWCFAEIEHGLTRKVIDLPLMGGLGRPIDEAWRLQAAIDRVAGHPQLARVSDRADGEASLDFFGPIPSWARKRLDLVGASVKASKRALFSCRLADSALAAEAEFLASWLWLQIDGGA